MDNKQIWQAVLGELELCLSKANFTTWFKQTNILMARGGEYIISVPNGFTKEWLQNKYHKNIARAIQNITSERVRRIDYEISKKNAALTVDSLNKLSSTGYALPVEKEEKPQADPNTGLNPRYTFETFIVGSNNELARAAALAICKNPGKVYNPFFIYGGVGLGKTHLMQAVGNAIYKTNRKIKVIYVTSERFMDDFISFIRDKKEKNTDMSQFKNKYRNCDVFLIDDIQFLAKRVGTQDAFFHTYNSLYQNNKQIILTSDKPPKAISGLEERLVSRFEGGMVADINTPDFETRKAILLLKCKERLYNINKEVLNYIAQNICSNIRELEGALSRIIAHSQLSKTEVTAEACKNILADLILNPSKKMIKAKQIINVVAEYYNIDIKDVMAKNRRKDIAWPRQIAMYIMRAELDLSYPVIGDETGGRDHTTAIHAHEKVEKEIKENDNLKQEIEAIKQKLYAD